MKPRRCAHHVYETALPNFCATFSASLFSKPSPARFENGRLFGSAQTRRVSGTAATEAAACKVAMASRKAELTRLRIDVVLRRSRTQLEHQELAAPRRIERKILRSAGESQRCIAH